MSEPKGLSAERLAEIRADYCMTDEWCLDHPDYAAEVRLWRELFAHIDALTARIADLEAERDALMVYGKNNQTLAEEHFKRAMTAEARALAARADALEEAAKEAELTVVWYGGHEAIAPLARRIRALAQPKEPTK